MTKTNFQSIDEYHLNFTDEMRERLDTIRKIIHKVSPKATGMISYQIPAFKIDKHFLVYYAGFKQHLTLSNPWSPEFLETFKEDLKGYKMSKAVIQFPNDQPLPKALIEKIIKFRKKEVDAKLNSI